MVVLLIVWVDTVSNVSVLCVSVSVVEVNLVSCSSLITSSDVLCIGTTLFNSSNSANVPDATSTSICTGCWGAVSYTHLTLPTTPYV